MPTITLTPASNLPPERMTAHNGQVNTSPQLEQVAREICDLDKQRNKYAESNWQIERPKLIISILQRHFPSGEGTVQCAGTKEYLELRDKMSPPLTPRKEEG